MTRIALLRHFPTAWNGERRLQGRTDVPLTAEARAALSGLALPEAWRQARIVTSPLKRARATAEALAAADQTMTEDPRLVELSWGDWEGQTAHRLARDPRNGFVPTHLWTLDTRAPGGESGREALARARPALADIAATPGPVLVVTHKALMRLILAQAGSQIEIKRARLYPLTLGKSGLPGEAGAPVRLEKRR